MWTADLGWVRPEPDLWSAYWCSPTFCHAPTDLMRAAAYLVTALGILDDAGDVKSWPAEHLRSLEQTLQEATPVGGDPAY